MIILTPLNNELIIEILNSPSFMLKNLKIFLKKKPKGQFLASWRVQSIQRKFGTVTLNYFQQLLLTAFCFLLACIKTISPFP